MKNWRKLTNRYKSISWLLIASILILTLLPAHYHIHHAVSEDLAHHEHVIDFHMMAEQTDPSHDTDDLQGFAATPEGVAKQTNPAFSPFIVLVFLLTLLLFFAYQIRKWLDFDIVGLNKNYPHFSPPLRAPPVG